MITKNKFEESFWKDICLKSDDDIRKIKEELLIKLKLIEKLESWMKND
jgi:hypothetical protein